MRKELTILIVLSALLVSFVTGYLITKPDQSAYILNGQRADIFDRFDGTVNTQLANLPIPDGLFLISEDRVLSPVNSGDDNVLYYHQGTGFVSRANIATRQTTLISSTELPRLQNVTWSSDREQVVTSYSGPRGNSFQYYRYTDQQHGALGTNITDVVFSPDGSKIALAESFGNETTIFVANTDGTDREEVLSTRLPEIKLFWPTLNLMAFSSTNSEGLGSVYTITKDGGLTQIIDSAQNLKILWSPDESRYLYSDINGLYLRRLSGKEESVGLSAAADHCSWYQDGKQVICATTDRGEVSLERIRLDDKEIHSFASNLIISPGKVLLSSSEKFLVIYSATEERLYGFKLEE